LVDHLFFAPTEQTVEPDISKEFTTLLRFQNAFTPPCPVRRNFNGNFGATVVKQQTPAQKFF
jgi:hypothetical protein